MSKSGLTRRNFLLNTSLLSAAAVLSGTAASILESCKSQDNPTYPNGGNLEIVDATLEGGKVILTIDSFSPLVSVGAAAMAQYSGGALLVARASQSTFDAVSPTCTYQACTINTYSNLLYTCPCCGSQFSILGAVKKGPAGSALRQYPTTFDGYLVTISI
jgi:Rieske Fe-S protein